MRKLVLTLTAVLAAALAALAQNQRITGRVTSSDGEPLAGVTVVVEGTQTGAVTDRDGYYSINAPAGSTLLFELLGMKPQQVAVTGQTRADVRMIAEMENIEDVIVVAYGTAKKEAFTGSAGVVRSAELAKRSPANVTNAIAGLVPGVQAYNATGQPGTGASIRIRGVGSMSSSNAPLYVVDGVPYEEDMMPALNSADIESMSILKDASASAIYGARGANGVVIITTKRGTSRDAVITLDARWGSNSKAVPRYDVIRDPAQYYELFYDARYNGLIRNGSSPEAANAAINGYLFNTQGGGLGYQVFSVPEGQRFIGLNGKLNPNATLGYSDGEYYYTPDDWYKELFGKGNFRQEYNLSVAGATDRANYYISGGYLDDTGLVPGSGFKRYTARFKGDFQAKKWLKIGANMNYTYYDQEYPGEQTVANSSGNAFMIAQMMGPIYPLYVRDAQGHILKSEAGYTVYDFGDASESNAYRPFMPIANPGAVLELDKTNYKANVFGGKWFANVDIVKGLRLSANIGVDARNELYTELSNKYYGQMAEYGGSVYKQENRWLATNQQYLLTYANSWGYHNLDLLGGFEHYTLSKSNLDGTRRKLYSDNVGELNNALLEQKAYSKTDKYSTMGFLFRAQYNYAEKYFLSASYRRDASSRFHKDNRWGNFGSVGAAWLMNKENWLSGVRWLSLLKLKASYGVQGNDNLLYDFYPFLPNYYPWMDQYEISESNGEFATTLYYKGNKDITWETSYNFNVGVEFGFFSDRLFGSIEYFNRKTTDMLYNEPVANSSGYSTVPRNIGDIRNSGVEVDLTGVIVSTPHVLWSVNANLAHYKNKILKLATDRIIKDRDIYYVGGSLYNYYVRTWAGVDKETGEPLYYKAENGEYKLDDAGNRQTTTNIAEAGAVDQGSLLPKVYGGFGTALTVHGFDFSISFAYQLGGRVLDWTYMELMHAGGEDNAGMGWHKDILKSWTKENPNTDVPALNYLNVYTNSISSRFLTSSDYLSINNITLGYTLPQKITKKWGINSVRFYFSADNVAVFARRKGLDPRQTLGGEVGGFAYSTMRTLSGGITFSF